MSTPEDSDPGLREPIVIVVASDDGTIDAKLEELASTFLEARRLDVTPDDLGGQAAGAIGAVRLGIGHGTAADALMDFLAGVPDALTHVIALHPRRAHIDTGLSPMDGKHILITAGATDPATPPDRVGALIDALDGAGATTQIVWTHGGPEITDEELEKATGFINALRSLLVDLRALPVRHVTEGAKGRYVIEAPGDAVAEMSYSRANEHLIIIDHTEVPEAFRGTGTGMRLLEQLIADARASDTRIIPICPFAAAQFDRHPEWADVLEQKVRVKTRSDV